MHFRAHARVVERVEVRISTNFPKQIQRGRNQMGNSSLAAKRGREALDMGMLALVRGDGGGSTALTLIQALLSVNANRVRALTPTQGPTATVVTTSPPITPTLGFNGRFAINAGMTVQASVAGLVTFSLLRDGVALAGAPTMVPQTTGGANTASATLEWVDQGPLVGAHTYSILATPAGGTLSTIAPQGFVVVQEVP
jgi:PAB1-binding protein PBP1